MEMSKRRNNFPFPSRVEGFLDCCGESFNVQLFFNLIITTIGKNMQLLRDDEELNIKWTAIHYKTN